MPTDEAYEKSVVGSALGPITFNFSIERDLTAGLLTPFEIWHIGLPLAPDEASEHSRLSREITDLHKALQRQHKKQIDAKFPGMVSNQQLEAELHRPMLRVLLAWQIVGSGCFSKLGANRRRLGNPI